MTRPSKREVERRVEALLDGTAPVADDRRLVVFADPETGAWYDDPALEGEPIEKSDADPKIVFREEVVETEWTPETGAGGVEP
jgi:hypothetical protein